MIPAHQRIIYTSNHYLQQTISKHEAAIADNECDEEEDDEEDEEDDAEPAVDWRWLTPKFVKRVKGASNEAMDALKVQVCLHSYTKVVVKREGDIVPAMVRHTFMEVVSGAFSDRLLGITNAQLAAGAVETEALVARRASVKEHLAKLVASQEVLNRLAG